MCRISHVPHLAFIASALQTNPARSQYLDRAIPVEGSCDKTDGLYVYKGVGVTNKVDRPAFWRGMAPTKEEFLDMLPYTDIGAVALALPMMVGGKYRRTGLAEMKLEAARSSLRCVLNNFVLTLDGEGKDSFAGRDGSDAGTNADQDDAGASFASANTPTKNEFELQCDINDSLSLDEALQMAREKPDMWEEVGLPMQGKGLGVYQQRKVELIPSKHAAVALNSFLWTHARGRNNTFG